MKKYLILIASHQATFPRSAKLASRNHTSPSGLSVDAQPVLGSHDFCSLKQSSTVGKVLGVSQLLLVFFPFFLLLIFPLSSHAQTASTTAASIITEKAQVIFVVNQSTEQIAGTSVTSPTQSIKIKILDGPDTGTTVIVDNDNFLSKVGDILYVKHTIDPSNGVDSYAVSDPYRLPVLGFFIGLFIFCAILFGGKQGFRGLIALGLGFLAIAYILLPGILHGFSPILLSMLVASLIVIVGSYITHGWNRVTTAAVVGMIATILLTSGLAYAAIHFGKLTGLATEEAVYLNFDTGGHINFAELLAGGILIGLLGILYDAAIGQAAAVDELRKIGPHLSRRDIFKRALRIGREHIGALINSLALAYVGVSLPLLLLFYSSSSASFLVTANSELFATEIIRAMIGSIGLILTVPLTTAVSVFFIVKPTDEIPGEHEAELEKKSIDRISHHHHSK